MGRLPTSAIVAMLRASIERAGGFVAIIRRGDADAGGLLLLTDGDPRAATGSDAADPRLWEWRTGFDGRAGFIDATPAAARAPDLAPHERTALLAEAVDRRLAADRDLWGVHLTVPSPEPFIASLTDIG